MRYAALISLTLLCVAPDNTASAASELRIQPSVCLLQPGETICRTDVAIEWSSTVVLLACLSRLDIADPLRCWRDEQRGEFRETLTTERSTVYLLTSPDNETLAEAKLDVLAVQPADKRRSRRSRHVWDLF